jgi:hypothetical protein
MKKIENKAKNVETAGTQKNHEELKKKADLTEKFIKFADKIEIDDKYVPKTEKGLETKAKELMEKLAKKLEEKEKIQAITPIKKVKKGSKKF